MLRSLAKIGYVQFAFDWLGADAITLHPYLGKDAILPFLERKEKGSIILCRTSNPGAGEFQDLDTGGKPLYQVIAEKVTKDWNTNGNCALVVGATYPTELEIVRRIVGDMPILVPGIGAQGGDVEATLKAGFTSNKAGLIINSSRSIIFASRQFCITLCKSPLGSTKVRRPVEPIIMTSLAKPCSSFNFLICLCAKNPLVVKKYAMPALLAMLENFLSRQLLPI